MNNKEFISELANRMSYTTKDTIAAMNDLVAEMTELLVDDKSVAIQNFGTFEVKKKLERVVVNPATQQRMLVPPKLVLNFRASTSLKEKMQ